MVEVVEEDTFAARALSLRRRQRARPLRSPTGVAGARILQRKPPPPPPPPGTILTKKEEEEAKKNRAEEKR